jgi:preprotein translocase subunit SecF
MIRFSKYIWLYILISAIVIIPGIYSLFRFGFRQSIDFAGGTLLELKVNNNISQSVLEKYATKNNLIFSSIQDAGENLYLLRTKDEDSQKMTKFIDSLNTEASATAEIIRSETVGPILGKELLEKAMIAAIFATIAILLYVAYAFRDFKFGVAAIASLLHDLLVILGCFSLFGHFWGVEVDTLFVTAFLTTMSFSVHDTIVILDRVREYQKKGVGLSMDDLCDRSLTETMGRSVTNSVTIILMLIALVLMGGETILWFSVALLIGTISGTYSSPFIATPILILWNRWEKNQKQRKK